VPSGFTHKILEVAAAADWHIPAISTATAKVRMQPATGIHVLPNFEDV
jgi:hypothetical protein